jgi:hypothetical protein
MAREGADNGITIWGTLGEGLFLCVCLNQKIACDEDSPDARPVRPVPLVVWKFG